MIFIPGSPSFSPRSLPARTGGPAGGVQLAPVRPGKALASSLGNALGVVLLALAFEAVKVCGACYLAWLGGTQAATPQGNAAGGGAGLFVQGVTVAVTNPKGILFFAALFPQFVEAGRDRLPRFALMTATFVGCAVTTHVCFIAAAPWAARRLRKDGAARLARRIGGVLFVGLGLGLLLLSRMG